LGDNFESGWKMAFDGISFEEPIRRLEKQIEAIENTPSARGKDLSTIERLKAACDNLKREIFSKLSPWERVQVARHPERPQTSDYIELMLDEFVELHGDRLFGDDRAIITGLARIGGKRILLVGQQKGKSTREKIACNFGCAHPEGYRKALLKMKLAEKFRIPVVTLIDTPGAYPGIGAEERGQAMSIAVNLQEMARLKVPIICVVIGEGGSGGALGIGVGDRLLIMEHAYYSVISPEGCAAILWKSGENAPQAAAALKMTASDLKELGIVDEVIPEPLGGAHRDYQQTASSVKEAILKHLGALEKISVGELLEQRYQRLRRIGAFSEGAAESISGGDLKGKGDERT